MHRNAAELGGVEKTDEVAANFEALPFAVNESDTEGDGSEDEGGAREEQRADEVPKTTPPSVGDETIQVGVAGSNGEVGGAGSVGSEGETKNPVSPATEGTVLNIAHSGPAVRVLKVPAALHGEYWLLLFPEHCRQRVICSLLVAYNSEAFQGYQLIKSFDNMLESSRVWGGGCVEEDEEEEEGAGVGGSDSDLHALLVKAWEAKVFPVIQRRFRNDQERKSGLEQIKGALQLGECLYVCVCMCVCACVFVCV